MTLTVGQREQWTQAGYLVLKDLLPEPLMAAYEAAYEAAGVAPHGWRPGTPYLDVPELLDLCCHGPLFEVMDELVGRSVALNLNLTGWVSTERQWHSDSYLSPEEVGDGYIAAWMALDAISSDAGPFECLPGSHLWPVLTRGVVFERLTAAEQADPDWPWFTEGWVAEHWETERAKRGVEPVQFLGERGDVLLWHPNLVHRGSRPLVPGTERRAVIAHYSAPRADMPDVREHERGRYIEF